MNADFGWAIFTSKDLSFDPIPGLVLAAVVGFALSGPSLLVFGEPTWVFAFVMYYFLYSYSVTQINCWQVTNWDWISQSL